MPGELDLATMLPVLLPRAVAWAEEQAARITALGQPLDQTGLHLAKRVGVARPERIRLLTVDRPPVPSDALLRQAAESTGLLGPDMLGLTLGYGILIRRDHGDARLISHECRHVHQYEQAGSINDFLTSYLQQIIEMGYTDAPYEVDARDHEIHE